MERTVTSYDGIGAGTVRPGSRIGALWRMIVTAIKIRGMRRSLEGLPDYLLKDMGISRSGIETALRQGRGRPDRSFASESEARSEQLV